MDIERINHRIKEIIADVGDLDVGEIEDDADFIEDLNLDSLALLELGVDVDYEFQLGVSDERLKELRSVAETVELVTQFAGQGQREIA
jgi:acyl carrier protein